MLGFEKDGLVAGFVGHRAITRLAPDGGGGALMMVRSILPQGPPTRSLYRSPPLQFARCWARVGVCVCVCVSPSVKLRRGMGLFPPSVSGGRLATLPRDNIIRPDIISSPRASAVVLALSEIHTDGRNQKPRQKGIARIIARINYWRACNTEQILQLSSLRTDGLIGMIR